MPEWVHAELKRLVMWGDRTSFVVEAVTEALRELEDVDA